MESVGETLLVALVVSGVTAASGKRHHRRGGLRVTRTLLRALAREHALRMS
jgi:hypothetical protein